MSLHGSAWLWRQQPTQRKHQKHVVMQGHGVRGLLDAEGLGGVRGISREKRVSSVVRVKRQFGRHVVKICSLGSMTSRGPSP